MRRHLILIALTGLGVLLSGGCAAVVAGAAAGALASQGTDTDIVGRTVDGMADAAGDVVADSIRTAGRVVTGPASQVSAARRREGVVLSQAQPQTTPVDEPARTTPQ
jgi:hypothetical protein